MQASAPAPVYLERLPQSVSASGQFLRGCGGSSCGGTGLFGRSTVCEFLMLESEIRAAICSGGTAQESYERAMEQGMATLWQKAWGHVLAGAAPLEETIQIVGAE